MIAFLGPVQALAISPFCTLEDVTAWVPADRITLSVFAADAVWRQLLISHFRSAFTCLVGHQESPPTPERLTAKLPGRELREVYAALQKSSLSCPFILEPRARLLLEIHELREWDRHLKQFLLQRQAACLAALFKDLEALERLRIEMAPPALELVSLQNMMGNGGAFGIRLSQLENEVRWSESADTDLRRLIEKRIQQRRAWWQGQRDYLLQDLGMH